MTNIMDAQPERYRELKDARKYDLKIMDSGMRGISRALELGALKRAISNIRGDLVLDAPCGTGRIDPLLRERFLKVVGLDSSEAMLTLYCRKDNARVGFLCDIFHMPFHQESFDWVVCHRLFHHFDTDELRLLLLKSIAKVAMQGVIFYAWVKTPLSGRGSSRRKTLNLDHIKRLIDQTGLEFVSVHYTSWPFQPKALLVCRKKIIN